MSITISRVSNSQFFDTWLERTNQLADLVSANVVTADGSSAGSVTTGNVRVSGFFSVNTASVSNALRGGNNIVTAALNVTSNVLLQNSTGGTTVELSSNATHARVVLSNASISIQVGLPTSTQIANGSFFLNSNGSYVYRQDNQLLDSLASTSITNSPTSNNLKTVYDAVVALGTTIQTNTLTVSGGATFGNSTVNATANGTSLKVGNSTVNVTINTLGIYMNGGTLSDAANVTHTVLTPGANVSWNVSTGRIASLTLTSTSTVHIDNPTSLKVGTYLMHVVNATTANVNWGSVFKWSGGFEPVFTAAANSRDILSFLSDGTNLYGSYMNDVR